MLWRVSPGAKGRRQTSLGEAVDETRTALIECVPPLLMGLVIRKSWDESEVGGWGKKWIWTGKQR